MDVCYELQQTVKDVSELQKQQRLMTTRILKLELEVKKCKKTKEKESIKTATP